MKKLRIIQSGYENYSGPIGAYEFVDGLSVEIINRPDRDRLSVAFQFEEVDAEGNVEPAGIAHRLVAERDMLATMAEPLERQTDDEKRIELVNEVINSDIPPNTHSLEDLHKIMDQNGIGGLREIAVIWNVKHRSATVLVQMILDKQAAYLAQRQRKLAEKVALEMAGLEEVQEPTEPPEDQDASDKNVKTVKDAPAEDAALAVKTEEDLLAAAITAAELLLAARTGDLTAAIKTE